MPEIDDFQESCLDAHNRLRAEHQCKPLKWNSELVSSAEDWANWLVTKGHMQHSDSTRFGENILVTDQDDDLSGEEVVDRWAEDEQLYDYTQSKWQKGTSCFTQMIWKSTTDVGIARAKMEDGRGFIVVHYKPAGNINRPGDYQANVLPVAHGGELGAVNGRESSDEEV